MKFTVLVFAALLITAYAEETRKSNDATEDSSKEKREAPPPSTQEDESPSHSQASSHSGNHGGSIGVNGGYNIGGHNIGGHLGSNSQAFPSPNYGIAPESWNGYSDQLAKLALANLPYASPASHSEVAGLTFLMGDSGSHKAQQPSFSSGHNSNGIFFGAPHHSLSEALTSAIGHGAFDFKQGSQNEAPVFGFQPHQGFQFASAGHSSPQALQFGSPIQLPQHYSSGIQGLGSFGNGHFMTLAPSSGPSHSFAPQFQHSQHLSGPIFSSSTVKGQAVPFGEQFLKGYTSFENMGKSHAFPGTQNAYKTSAFKPSTFLGAGFESASARPTFLINQNYQNSHAESLGPQKFGDSFSSPNYGGHSSLAFAPSFTSNLNKSPVMSFNAPDSFLQASNIRYSMPTTLYKSNRGYKVVEGQGKKKQKSFEYNPSLSYGHSDNQGGYSDNTYNTIKYSTEIRAKTF